MKPACTPNQTLYTPWASDSLFERSSDLVCLTAYDGSLRRVNPAWSQAMGYAQTALPAEPLFRLIYAADQEHFQAAFADTVATGALRTVTARCPISAGAPRWIEWQLSADADLGLVSALGRDITAQRQTDDRLRLFETLVEHMPDAVSVAGPDGRQLYFNSAFRQMIGAAEDTTDIVADMLIDPDEVGRMQAEVLPTLLKQQSWRGRVRHRKLDGSIFLSDNLAFVIHDAQGDVQAIGRVMRDVTEQERAEQELRLAKFTIERSPDNIHWIDPTSTIVYANDGACAMLGYRREELEGLMVTDIDPVFSLQNWDAVWSRLKQQGILTFETVYRRKDGSSVPVDIVTNYLEFEGREYGCVLARDISKRKEAEVSLVHTASLLQATLESTSDGILVVDNAGGVTHINQQFLSLWRIPEEIIATHDDAKLLAFVVDQFADPAAFVAKINALYDQPDASSYDILTFKDGRVFERYSHPQRVAGVSIGRVWNFRDITERQRAEAERIALKEQVITVQQERLRELSTPLIPIADGVVVMPLIATLDSARAQQVLETLLEGVVRLSAKVAILDITGVLVVDTQVANALLRAAQAVRLLGASMVLTGIRPEIAQTLVNLGVDLRGIVTRGSLQSGIAFALQHQ